MTRRILWGGAAALALLAWTLPTYAGDIQVFQSTTRGNPKVKSIDAIAFGPQGVLLIGDGRGAQVIAVDTGDTKPQKWTRTEVAKITDELAGKIGTTGKGIEITKMAVNPASHSAYFAIRKLDDKKDLIMVMEGSGKVRELDLESVKYARLPLPAGEKGPITKITDIAWATDRVLTAAQANEEFGSKFFSIPVPLENEGKSDIYSTETYHVAHKRWETKAPIKTIMPYEENGKRYLVGAFTCTPLVKYPLDKINAGGKVKGTSVIEVGNGNHPRDMFAYEKDGKTYILMSTFRMFHKQKPVGPSPYWTVRIDNSLLAETDKVNEKATLRVDGKMKPLTDRAQVIESYHGVVHLSRLDRERALVVRTDDKGGMSLAVLPLP